MEISLQTKYDLHMIFDELCKKNLSILTLDVKKCLSNVSIQLANKDMLYDENSVECLKYLILICNLLYNRTDMLVLPVEDGVYDLLMERYKAFDPNFQVGSAVVQFQSEIEKEMIKQGKPEIVSPFHFFTPENKDDTRIYFEQQLRRFDKRDRFNANEVFYKDDTQIAQSYISKRTHNTKHNHPTLVGTLDKCKFVLDADAIEKDVYDDPSVAILERDFFRKHINAGIISENEDIEMVLELKYDGVSVEADCTDSIESARTRGDTGIGEAADITPILAGYRFPRNTVLQDREVGVKFEAIMTKTNLDRFNIARGYTYANCRTAIVGLFGASDANSFKDYITLIPLALDRDNVPDVTNRIEEIELLNALYRTKGEPLRYCYIHGNYKVCLFLIKKFAEEAKYARNYLDFMFDGIVISYLDEGIRNRLGRENYINKFSMAVKFDPMCKLTTFLGYTFEVGQTGNICPMIHYSPVEFYGTIHPKSSGASLKRFTDLALRPGDIIEVTYRNDVMPYVTKLDCEANRLNENPLCEFPLVCPICGSPLEISTSGKSANCPNVHCDGRRVARITNMLQKLNIKGFAESTIVQIGKYSLHELLELSENDIMTIGPTNAANFIASLRTLMSNPTEDYKLIGALGFTGCAAQTWKLIFKEFTLREFVDAMEENIGHVFDILRNIKGLGDASANVIIDEYDFYKEDIIALLTDANVIDSKNIMTKKQIRFTGCRNKQLEDQLNSMGYDANGSAAVTKQTDILIIPYDGFSSTKTSKVSENTMVIPINEFMENMGKYL